MAKFFWNYLNILPSFDHERLSSIEEALEWQIFLLERKINALTAEHGKAIKPIYTKAEWQKYIQNAQLPIPSLFPAQTSQDTPNFLLFAELDSVYTFPKLDEEKLEDSVACQTLIKPGFTLETLPARPHCLPVANHGGSITYHGPGQLILYLICDLQTIGISLLDLNKAMEGAVKDVLMSLGVKAYTLKETYDLADPAIQNDLILQGAVSSDETGKRTINLAASGVWMIADGLPSKIMSRGIKAVRQHYSSGTERIFTLFGFALNLSTDLSYYDAIFPCGLNLRMTSVHKITGEKHSLPKVAKMLAIALVKQFSEISGKAHELI